MRREEALQKLIELKGSDLVELAKCYNIDILYKHEDGRITKNKGWAGIVIERCLGLPFNSAQAPNFGSWELKLVSLRYLKSGMLVVKETMQITMLNDDYIIETPFEESHLLTKMRKMLVVSRIWYNKMEPKSEFYDVVSFNLEDNSDIYNQVRDDYNEARRALIRGGVLKSEMGCYIQPRTKGRGHGSTSRAFYARRNLLTRIILG
ncbi:MAG: hypothetical protein GF403_10855 [Candidatus Coatesbacteria bacterium]|nr:hypothetical protein [Candidatus Coatesbacteria bacterium]